MMINIFKQFNDNNCILIERTANIIEDFCNEKLKIIEKNHFNYNEKDKMLNYYNGYDKNIREKKHKLYLSMITDKEILELKLQSYLKSFSLILLKSGFSNSEYLNIEAVVKDEKKIDIKLNFNYSFISKQVILSSIDINNEFFDKSFHRFYNNSKSLIIYIGEEKKELENNSGQKLSNLDFIEIVSENGIIQSFYALTEEYEKMFEIKNNHSHNIEDIFEERNNVKNTHEFYKLIRETIEFSPEIAYKCAFGNNENIQELTDLLLINYDVVFNENFKLFYIDTTQYNNIKLMKKKEYKNLKI